MNETHNKLLYVFLCPSIINMGGAQMYIRNKVTWLKGHAWEVEVISAQKGNIILPELKGYNNFIPELNYCNYIFGQKKQKKILNNILGRCDYSTYNKVVVESTCIEISTWGEIMAKEIGAKHLIFLLQEDNRISDSNLQNFFIFKLHRHELAGITNSSLLNMFAPFSPIPPEKSYRLPAFCNNVEADVPCSLIDKIGWNKYDYRIGCLSRLNKPFVFPVINDFIKYANKNSNKKFLFVMMGDSPKGTDLDKKLMKLFSKTNNIDLLLTGYLYPVPVKLLEKMDVFFTSAGSCWTCSRSGVPTIAIDGKDFKSIGILGHTTNNTLFRNNNEPQLDLSVLLDDILIKKKYLRKEPSYKSGLPDFGSHMGFIDASASSKEYFNLGWISHKLLKSKKLKFGLYIFGAKNYHKLGLLKERFRNRI